MNWLATWGPAIVAAIVSVVMAAGFTWWFGVRNERDHQRGVRALVRQEVVHNVSEVAFIKDYLNVMLTGRKTLPDMVRLMRRTTSMVPRWQRSRWDLPDVGVAFTYDELAKLTVWYFALDSLSSQYGWLVSCVRSFDLGDPRDADEKDLLETIEAVEKYAESVLKEQPSIPGWTIYRTPDPDVGAGSEGIGRSRSPASD